MSLPNSPMPMMQPPTRDRHGVDEHAVFASALEGQGDDAAESDGPDDFLDQVLAFEGNIADLLAKDSTGTKFLGELGALVVQEYELDETGRQEWKEGAERALKAAGQTKQPAKTYPIANPGSANVNYPLLTTAAIQFAARAYPAIVRGDEVVDVKVNGQDVDGAKSERAERVAAFSNDQIMYQCPEWEPGTDALLHQLPITGKAFRKVYWDANLGRPRFDFCPALKVCIPADAPSLEMSPRVTHLLDIYPYDYERKVANGDWRKCQITAAASGDSQAKIAFLEQCRYIDLDEDGLSEPWIVTVHKDSRTVVRIDPAFAEQDIVRGRDGSVRQIERLLPWIDYDFIPDPQGGVYAIGFGKLLEEISATINTLLNQMIDAGHWSNTNTGFIGAGVKTRGGTIQLEPNAFKMLPGVTNLREAIQKIDFPGPSAVSFNLVEMLLAAAKDITAVKDVISGDMPGGQHVAEGTVMALIEQGLQVFTSIYKRIYRSMTREFALQCRLNARYLSQEDYQRFLDERPPAPPQQPPPQMGHNGGPAMTPEDMGAVPPPQQPPPPMPQQQQQGGAPDLRAALAGIVGPQQQQQPQQMPADPRVDFDGRDMDVRPVSDPSSITEMQRMAKIQFLLALRAQDPQAPINGIEIYKEAIRAARVGKIERFLIEKNPAIEKQAQLQMEGAEADVAKKKADVALVTAQVKKTEAEASTAQAAAQSASEHRQRELDQRDRELAQRDTELHHAERAQDIDLYKQDISAAETEARLIMEAAKGDRDALLKWMQFKAGREDQAHTQRQEEAALDLDGDGMADAA